MVHQVMMIDENRIPVMRAGGGYDVNDICNTLEALWKVARAARKWVKASPGADSANAESDLVDELDAFRDVP